MQLNSVADDALFASVGSKGTGVSAGLLSLCRADLDIDELTAQDKVNTIPGSNDVFTSSLDFSGKNQRKDTTKCVHASRLAGRRYLRPEAPDEPRAPQLLDY